MAKYDYNLIVIGGGSAGLIASLISATLKAKTMLIESDRMGGDCLNTGCVPSKTLIASAKVAQSMRQAKEFGIRSEEPKVDFPSVMRRVHNAIRKIEPNDSIERYTSLGVDCVKGKGKIVDAHRVKVNDDVFAARSIVVASGASPTLPPVPGLRESVPLTTENLWELKTLPKRLVILGGGPIGSELAQAFSRLGSEVTLVEMLDRILPLEDADASAVLTATFQKEGVNILTGWVATRCEPGKLTIKSGEDEQTIDFDNILVATGRAPLVNDMGLQEVGVELNPDRTIKTNDYMQTTVRSIYACGDVVGPYQFTHMASHQAWYASVNSLIRPFWRFKTNMSVVPWATFTDPELARVGLSEQQAKDQNLPHDVTVFPFDDSDRSVAEGTREGFVKLITPRGKDKLLGACIVGVNAGELIASCVNTMSRGGGMDSVLSTIHVYPTRMESIKFAAGKRRKANAPNNLLNYSKHFMRLLR